MSQLLLTAIFIVIWIPSIFFSLSNTSIVPPLKEKTLQGPYFWKYEKRDIYMNGFQPEFLLNGKIKTKSRPYQVAVHANFMEWIITSRRFNNSERVFHTGLEDRPFITEWGLEHDDGLSFSQGEFRFNWIFVFSLFFCLALPVLYILMLFADNVVIDSPEVRKRKANDYDDLIKTIEAHAKKDPKWLKRKTLSLAFLGYFVVCGSIILMIPVGIGLFGSVVILTGGNVGGAKLALILALIPLGFACHLGKSLLSSGGGYEGVEIHQKDCPELISLLENICIKAEGPMFKRIYIDENLNASVSRSGGFLGFFGMGPVVLTLGLPLMQSMTNQQLSGVIAHEYGHVAAKDNAWGQWVYRIRSSWLMLGERLVFDTLWYALKLNRFYDWFIVRFSAHSFALSRRCEYEADAFSARLIGKEAMADALSSLVVFGNQYDDLFWKNIWDRSEKGEDIQSVTPYAGIPKFFASLGDVSEAASFALKQKTNYSATHPSISDRLAALSANFNLPQAPGKAASSHLLGGMERKLINRFEQQWKDAVYENWKERQDGYKKLLERNDELLQKSLQDLSDDELWELISAASHLNGHNTFYAANKEVLRRHPENTDARLNCIWHKLIIEQDGDQLAIMEDFVLKHPEYLPNICRYAIEFLSASNREDETETYYQRLENWEHVRSAAEDERNLVLASDEYKTHDLPSETIENFRQYFTGHPIISKVYLTQKVVKYMSEFPAYIIAYKTRADFWLSQKKIAEQVQKFIYESGLPSEYSFIEVGSVKRLKSKITKVKGSQIYKRT